MVDLFNCLLIERCQESAASIQDAVSRKTHIAHCYNCRLCNMSLQCDPSGRSKPPVDIDLKVAF